MLSYYWCVIKYLIKIPSAAQEANREIKAFVARGEAFTYHKVKSVCYVTVVRIGIRNHLIR